MRISDWSSDVCSSDLTLVAPGGAVLTESAAIVLHLAELHHEAKLAPSVADSKRPAFLNRLIWFVSAVYPTFTYRDYPERWRSEEHTSELQSLMRITYAVFCLKKKKKTVYTQLLKTKPHD